ncbi:hypothetical protein GVAV_002209 [Gurleya vavrai]
MKNSYFLLLFNIKYNLCSCLFLRCFGFSTKKSENNYDKTKSHSRQLEIVHLSATTDFKDKRKSESENFNSAKTEEIEIEIIDSYDKAQCKSTEETNKIKKRESNGNHCNFIENIDAREIFSTSIKNDNDKENNNSNNTFSAADENAQVIVEANHESTNFIPGVNPINRFSGILEQHKLIESLDQMIIYFNKIKTKSLKEKLMVAYNTNSNLENHYDDEESENFENFQDNSLISQINIPKSENQIDDEELETCENELLNIIKPILSMEIDLDIDLKDNKLNVTEANKIVSVNNSERLIENELLMDVNCDLKRQ